MSEFPVRANFFDASALAKIFTDEHGSEFVVEFFHNNSPTKFTTPFCFYETLNVLKSKWIHRKQLSKSQYLEASFRLVAWYRLNTKHVTDLELSDPVIFNKTRELAELYSLDISDAFQLLTVKKGDFSSFINDSKTLLITADKGLANAASKEGIKTWYCLNNEIPK